MAHLVLPRSYFIGVLPDKLAEVLKTECVMTFEAKQDFGPSNKTIVDLFEGYIYMRLLMPTCSTKEVGSVWKIQEPFGADSFENQKQKQKTKTVF